MSLGFRTAIRALALGCMLLGNGCPGRKAGGVVEVSFWHVMGGPVEKSLNGLCEEFNRTHPGIRVMPLGMGSYDALSQKLLASVAAGKPPVLSQAYESWTAKLIESRAVVPIQEFASGPDGLSQEERSDIYPVLMRSCTIRDTLWAWPFNKSVPALYYNRNLFRKSGLNPDMPPATWEDFRSAGRKLTRKGVLGTAFKVDVWDFGCLLYQNGGSYLTPDRKHPAFQAREGVEALRYWRGLLSPDSAAYLTTGFENQNDFLLGKVGMIRSSCASLSYLDTLIKFDLGLAALPGGKRKAVILAGTNAVIFAKASPEQKRAAWLFLKWMSEPEQTARWSAESSYLPIMKSALTKEVMQAKLKRFRGLEQVISQLEYAELEPNEGGWLTGRKVLETEALEKALRGQAEPGPALEDAARKVEKELAKE
jgi:ABC-type glycerol-3-phosphate transport system substrate-binding protein